MSAVHNPATDRSSILGPTLRFKGELTASEDVVVHGQVEGTIGPVPKLTVGPEAYVKAGVIADVIVIEGRVEGDLKAQVAITLHSRANVRGNLEAPSIIIAEGATFNGGMKMEPVRTEANVRPMRSGEPGPARTGTAD
jgi:cytoskeletal protein CcmA (bactofilin family)